jgi:tRNA threonylcarbamoyladenosine biosynthesis protein TsaB
VAVLHDAQTLHSISHDTSEDYSSWLLPAVHAVLQTAGTALPDVDAYAVATGPGSFTGVRVGLTTVKAWSEVYARPIVGVSRLEAMATEASGDSPYVAAFTDAHRMQVFGAMYQRDAGQLQRIDEESVIAPEEFLAWVVEIAGGSRVDWISTDPNCITQTQGWRLRQAVG